MFVPHVFWGWVRRHRLVIASALFCLLVIVHAKSPAGDMLGRFTDHLHHVRATWTFLHLGTEVYVLPFDVTGNRVPYPHWGVTWGQFPITYPPGMFLVFMIPTFLGAWVPMSDGVFGGWCIGYLMLATHAFLAAFRSLWTERNAGLFDKVMLGFLWLFSIRAALLGFYDGFWLLCGVMSARAMRENNHARALLWFAAGATMSFRAASLVPLAFAAFLRLWASENPFAKKALATTVALTTGLATTLAFIVMMKHLPPASPETMGAGSKLLPISFNGYAIATLGLLAAGALAYYADWVTALSVALSSVLSIHHAGHTWHGFICFPPFFAYAISKKQSPIALTILAAWFLFFIELAFDYTPAQFAQELIRFVEYGGKYPN